MMKVSKEVDSMMWDIANSGDFNGIENFKKQFPDLHSELSRRVLLLKDFRKAKALQVSAVPRPPFAPKARIRRYVSMPIIAVSALAVAGVALGVTSIGGVGPVIGKRHLISKAQLGPESDFCFDRNTGIHPRIEPLTGAPASSHTPDGSVTSQPSQAAQKIEASPTSESKSPDSLIPPPVKLRVTLLQVPLSTVIDTISSTFKVEVKAAPNLPNPIVDVDEEDTDGRGLLKRLGQKYGFGVVSEGKNSVLLVPTN